MSPLAAEKILGVVVSFYPRIKPPEGIFFVAWSNLIKVLVKLLFLSSHHDALERKQLVSNWCLPTIIIVLGIEETKTYIPKSSVR